MNTAEQKVLHDSLSKLYKIDQETLASLYNDAGELTDLSKILELDAARISKYKGDTDSQYKRGVKEAMQKFEKELKEKYELDSDLTGIDLVDSVLVQKVEDVKTSTKDITKHPDYIKLQVSIEKQLKDRDKEWQSKIEAKDKEFSKAKLFEKVRDKALANLEAWKAILPQDPRKAQSWKDTFLNELRAAEYQEDESGAPIVLSKDGAPLTSAHGKIISFDEWSRDIADKYFDYQKAEERSSSGNKEQKKDDNGWVAPKNVDEYMKRVRDEKITPDERIKLTEWFTKNNN